MDEQAVTKVPLFAGLSKKERRAIARCADRVDLPEGRHLVDEGEFAYEFFVLEEGSADVVHEGRRLAELVPGDFFGEMALVADSRRNASVIATSPVTVIVLTAQSFRQVKRDMPSVAAQIERAIAERRAALAPA